LDCRITGPLSSVNLLRNSIGVDQAQTLIRIKALVITQKKTLNLCGLRGDETTLDLGGLLTGPRRLTSADAMIIADGIKANSTLERLDLSDNIIGGSVSLIEESGQISDDAVFNSHVQSNLVGLRAFASMIQTHSSLRVLDMANNGIKSQALEVLAPAICAMPALSELNLASNNLTFGAPYCGAAFALHDPRMWRASYKTSSAGIAAFAHALKV
jgi:Leucine-rich repeat (LRR) protein